MASTKTYELEFIPRRTKKAAVIKDASTKQAIYSFQFPGQRGWSRTHRTVIMQAAHIGVNSVEDHGGAIMGVCDVTSRWRSVSTRFGFGDPVSSPATTLWTEMKRHLYKWKRPEFGIDFGENVGTKVFAWKPYRARDASWWQRRNGIHQELVEKGSEAVVARFGTSLGGREVYGQFVIEEFGGGELFHHVVVLSGIANIKRILAPRANSTSVASP